MKDRLILSEYTNGHQHRIAWFIVEHGEEGAVLGEDEYTEADLAKCVGRRVGEWEHVAATIAVSKIAGVQHDRRGYYWESRKDASSALRAARAAIKDRSAKPWPEWAVKASAEGWKPPKGWAP